MYRIFIVEDDAALAAALRTQLENYGNEVITACDFSNVTAEFCACSPQLVLMDITLPFRNGFYWCGEIRRASTVPIVFLSSASDNMNIVMAMSMGGDDFIAKPVDPMVLNAKVSAVLRRTYEFAGSAPVQEFHGAMLDLSSGNVVYEGSTIELTRNEFRILKTLIDNRGRIVSRDALMNALWQDDMYVEENTLTVNVARLRKKLDGCGLKEIILTKPGSGYILK